MKALTYEGPHNIAYSTIDDPKLFGLDGAIVRVTACGICGSDLHIYEGHGFSADLGFCVGHESVGEVVEVGSRVSEFKVGDRVMVTASTGCGRCSKCRAGFVLACERGMAGCYGLGAALPGSQAEAVGVPAADGNLVKLDDSISQDAAIMLTDNLPTAWYGARRARIGVGETVAVVGLGPVGLMSVASAFAMGAGRVFAVDLVPERRARAEAMGAEPIESDDARAAIGELTKGKRCDVVLEAVGADATIQLAMGLAGLGGRVSIVGVNQSRAFPFDMAMAQILELEVVIGLCSVQRELPTLLKLVERGRIKPEIAVSHHMALSDGPDAYALFANRVDGVSKVVLDPSR